MSVSLAHFSYWGILWLVPRTILAINQEHVINGKLDPKWSDYIASLVGDYSEDVQPATEPRKRQEPTPQNGWSIAGVGEAPFLAVVYSEQAHQHRTTLDFDKAGTSCGGAMITADKVITLCACVASWWMFHLKGVWDPDGKEYRFSEYNIKSKYLHVAHTKQYFDPDSLSSKIIPNKTAIELQTKCTKYIEGKGHPIEQQVIMVILEMQTPVNYPIPGQYIPWPPAPIVHDSPKDSPATIISFGMRSPELPPKHFYNEYGDELLLNITAVNFRIKKVFVSLCSTIYAEFSKEIQFRSTCFYPELAPKQELCQGLIGSPVIVGSNFQGLLATPVGCYSTYGELVVLNFVKEIKEFIEKFAGAPQKLKDRRPGVFSISNPRGELVVLDFVKEVQERIENFTGGSLLQQLNTNRPALWREAELPRGFVAYEDGILGPTKESQSSAVVHDPSSTLILYLIGVAHWCLVSCMFIKTASLSHSSFGTK